jgi:hypothetical protein
MTSTISSHPENKTKEATYKKANNEPFKQKTDALDLTSRYDKSKHHQYMMGRT